jgi:predicted acetyltransferase
MQNLEKGANNLEIRAIRSNEYDLFRQTVIDALFITESSIDRFTHLSRDMDLSTTRALFIDGSMVSALCLIPFEVTFGNAAMPMAGISMVTTPPERRKHGYMRYMIEAILHEMQERGFVISCLHTSSINLYRRFGWDVSSNILEFSLTPDQIAEQPKTDGRIVRFGIDSVEKAARVYKTFAKTKNCEIVRDKDHWSRHVLLPDRHCYLCENSRGEVEGYLIYEIFDQSLPRIRSFGADAKEFIALSHEARCAMFTLMKGLLPQIQSIVFRVAPNDPCLYYFPNRRVEAKLLPGFMARIIDVKKAFEMKQYAPDVVGKVVFDVKDSILPSNHDRFMLEVEGGRGHVKRTKKNAHFSCDINTLSQIFCGHLDLVQALGIGKIVTPDIGKIATANRLFSELAPYMHDWF